MKPKTLRIWFCSGYIAVESGVGRINIRPEAGGYPLVLEYQDANNSWVTRYDIKRIEVNS